MPEVGNNLGTIAPESGPKSARYASVKARRTNKLEIHDGSGGLALHCPRFRRRVGRQHNLPFNFSTDHSGLAVAKCTVEMLKSRFSSSREGHWACDGQTGSYGSSVGLVPIKRSSV